MTTIRNAPRTLGLGLGLLVAAFAATAAAEEQPQDPTQQPGCTIQNGQAIGRDCPQGTAVPEAGSTEQGMPATPHQQESLASDPAGEEQATGGPAASTQLPATPHQEEVLQEPAAGGQDTRAQ